MTKDTHSPMRIQFDYGWHTDDQTVMRYSARDNWTWKDYHAVVHVSQFALGNANGPVHVLLDFSTGHRERFPSGLGAHARTFGKRTVDALSGKVVVVGVPEAALTPLGLSESRRLVTADGEAHFVDTLAEAETLLANWSV
jgi:hypothetical protein